jgi:hypothetical protein
MDINTEYAAKHFFPNPSFVQIFFEAVANAFDAGASEISISIVEDPLSITISDNGQGFTNDRFERFARLGQPADLHHKGLGRLVYLKYFSNVQIVSIFQNTKRSFVFSESFTGKRTDTEASSRERPGTTLRFNSFVRARLQTKDDIKPAILKDRILEQFLPLLHIRKKSKQDFEIRIACESKATRNQDAFLSDSQSLTVGDVPELECRAIPKAGLNLYADVLMYYALREKQRAAEKTLTAACVDGRTISINNLLGSSAIPETHSAIFLFESELFAGSDSPRERLVLPENVSESTLYSILRQEIALVLNEKLPEIGARNTVTKQRFEERYPHLIGLFDDATVGLINRDDALNGAQALFFKKQKEVLESDSLDDATFEKSLEVSSRALTEYVLYRELIIKQLKRIGEKNKESDVHDLIVPRNRRFHEASLIDGIYNNNAWLLDDRFMSYRTILSEQRMKDLIEAITSKGGGTDGRPDIAMVFSADPAQVERVDVAVIELKRRTPEAKENFHAATQLAQRAIELVKYYPTIQRVWYYAIIDIDDEQAQLLQTLGWVPLFSRGHHVFYREAVVARAGGGVVPAPMCLLSYDAVIKDAAARNHAFLEILKTAFKSAVSHKGS